MAITCHIRRNEHPLWELIGIQVLLKLSEILDIRQSVTVTGDRIEHDSWIMFSNIIVSTIGLIDESEALKAAVGHVFLVRAPADFLVF